MKIKEIKSIGKQKVYKQIRDDVLYSNCINLYSNKKIGKRYVVSLDYDAQEYRVAAVCSQDSRMLNNFIVKKIDPHTATAHAIWGEENYDKSKRKKAKICVGDNVLMQTDKGYVMSQDLKPNMKLIDENGNPQTWIREMSEGDLIQITYDNGFTESYTPEHPVRTWNGHDIVWCAVKDLTVGSNVAQVIYPIQNNKSNPIIEDFSSVVVGKFPKDTTTAFNINCKEFAYLGGLYLGDGNLMYKKLKNGTKKPNAVSYCVQPDSLDTVCDYFKTLGLKPTRVKPIGKNGKIYRVVVCNIAWAACIDKHFGATKNKQIHTKFNTTWNKDMFKYLIAGLIDTDGFVRENKVSFSTTSKLLTETIIKACKYVGIKTTVRDRTTKYKGEPYPWTEVRLWGIEESLPTLNESKSSEVKRERVYYGTWNIDEEHAKEYRELVRSHGFNWLSNLYKTWGNVVAGKCGVTQGIVNLMHENDIPFPIKKNMSPLKVVRIKKTTGRVHVIETETHTYCTFCTASHNCNFTFNYGGGAHTLAQALDIPLAEAERMIQMYNKTFHEMIEWKEDQVRKMYENDAVVYSAFGRPRQFKGWVNAINKNNDSYTNLVEKQQVERASNRVRMAIERRVSSHLIQGCCGDILRKTMLDLYKKYFQHRDPHIDFMSTVHDEINYTIDVDVVIPYLRELENIMTFTALDPRLPIATSTDIGLSYGSMFPFIWTDDTKSKLIPKRTTHA